eukprot:1181608-Prorocentrum_minimum.AAC.1
MDGAIVLLQRVEQIGLAQLAGHLLRQVPRSHPLHLPPALPLSILVAAPPLARLDAQQLVQEVVRFPHVALLRRRRPVTSTPPRT